MFCYLLSLAGLVPGGDGARINTKSHQHSSELGLTVSHYWTPFLCSQKRPEHILSELCMRSLIMTHLLQFCFVTFVSLNVAAIRIGYTI